jgi:hypothetical protein
VRNEAGVVLFGVLKMGLLGLVRALCRVGLRCPGSALLAIMVDRNLESLGLELAGCLLEVD